MAKQMSESEIERHSVEWVFGLTGGELDDKPLSAESERGDSVSYPYHFEGIPDYAGEDFKDKYDSGVEYFTIVTVGLPPKSLTFEDGRTFNRVADFSSSGETECPGQHDDDGPKVTADHAVNGLCQLCEASEGEDHGHIYLGDGWCEAVYRYSEHEHRQEAAAAHNIEVWKEDCAECDSCGATSPADYYRDSMEHEGDCPEVRNPESPYPTTFTKGKWWWWCCSPGCLPESAAIGPFDSEDEALEDATQGLEEGL